MQHTQSTLNGVADTLDIMGFNAAAQHVRSNNKPKENIIFAAKWMCRNGKAEHAASFLAGCYKLGLCNVLDLRQAQAIRDKEICNKREIKA